MPFTRQTLSVFFIALVAGCSASPKVESSRTFESPNAELVATLESVDNGLGFGLGALYEEVHIGKRNELPSTHGEKSPSVAFYIQAAEHPATSVSVRWLGNNELEISHHSSIKPGKAVSALAGVSIKYRVAS
ncbi:hypothetical protein [Leptothrix ochracea]|uniref:hypothetical protein n=1 Tax=Leptothrix ochracea TaxID=735331 RepID=UPI0034E1D865